MMKYKKNFKFNILHEFRENYLNLKVSPTLLVGCFLAGKENLNLMKGNHLPSKYLLLVPYLERHF